MLTIIKSAINSNSSNIIPQGCYLFFLVFTNFPSQFTGQNLNANLATTAKYDNVFADKAKETTVWSWLFPFKLEDIKLHTVVYGETLETIAKKYETSIEEILNFNEGLDADKLKEGQKIKIPN